MTRESDLKDSLFLVQNGVPFDVAFSLGAFERKAWIITIGELNGLVWDYAAGAWK